MRDFSRLEQTSIPRSVIVDETEPQTECLICGEMFEEDGYKICPSCMREYATPKNAIEYGADECAKKKVEINGFLATVFAPEQIDEILKREYLEAVRLSGDRQAAIDYCGAWIRDDSFADFINNKIKEEK